MQTKAISQNISWQENTIISLEAPCHLSYGLHFKILDNTPRVAAEIYPELNYKTTVNLLLARFFWRGELGRNLRDKMYHQENGSILWFAKHALYTVENQIIHKIL
jgi:hypothetical protein